MVKDGCQCNCKPDWTGPLCKQKVHCSTGFGNKSCENGGQITGYVGDCQCLCL